MMRRSSFINKDIYNPAHLSMGERRNIPEIVIGILRNISQDPKPGSISSLRCHKSRMPVLKGHAMRSDVLADDVFKQ
jgi:hypothetical protein